MQNESGLAPLGRAVLIVHYEPEKKDSLIELPDMVKDRTLLEIGRAHV